MRFVKFAIVGGSGLLVNMFFLWFLKEMAGLHYLFASIIAIELSVLNNFVWNNFWTWGDRQKAEGWDYLRRLVKYNLSVSVAALIGNIAVLVALKEIFGWNYLLANLIGISIGMIINFIINDLWTLRERPVRGGVEQPTGIKGNERTDQIIN